MFSKEKQILQSIKHLLHTIKSDLKIQNVSLLSEFQLTFASQLNYHEHDDLVTKIKSTQAGSFRIHL